MKTLSNILPETLVEWVVVIAAVAAILLATGCQHNRGGPTTAPRPDGAALVAGHEVKDATVLSEADAIDRIAPVARPHTDAQRAAVAAAPAAQIASLNAEWTKVADALQREVTRLQKENTALRNQALREQSRWLTGAGIGCFFGFGLAMFFSKGTRLFDVWPLVPIGLGCFVLAQIVGHPWFAPAGGLLLLGVVTYSCWWAYDRHKQGRLVEKLQKRADILKKIVPVLDEARQSAASILDTHVFKKLGDGRESPDERAEIHLIRAEAKLAAAFPSPQTA